MTAMGLPAAKRRYTVAEYLELERNSAERHEYNDGEILAMAGGTPEHSLLVANVIREVGNRLKGKPCRVYDANLRVAVSGPSRYLYPDSSVICGPVEYDLQDVTRQTVMNPRLVVEVLSPSTEAYDRGEKFTRYRAITSFQEYVLVSQHAPLVETYFRQADGTWLVSFFSGMDAVAQLPSLDVRLPLHEIYADVTFPPDPDDPPADVPTV